VDRSPHAAQPAARHPRKDDDVGSFTESGRGSDKYLH